MRVLLLLVILFSSVVHAEPPLFPQDFIDNVRKTKVKIEVYRFILITKLGKKYEVETDSGAQKIMSDPRFQALHESSSALENLLTAIDPNAL